MKKTQHIKSALNKKLSEKVAKKHANHKALKKLAKTFSLGSEQLAQGHYEKAHATWFDFYHAVAELHEFRELVNYIETAWTRIETNKKPNFLIFFEKFLDRYSSDLIVLLEKYNNSSFIEGKYCTVVKIGAPLTKTIDKLGEYLFLYAKHAMDKKEFQRAADLFERCAATFDKYIHYLSEDSESDNGDMAQVARVRQASCHCYIIYCFNNLNKEDLNPPHGEKLAVLHTSFKDFSTDNVYFSGLHKSTIALMATFFPAAFSKGTDSGIVSLLGKKSLGITRLLHGIEKGEEGFENIAFAELISELRRAMNELQNALSLNGLSQTLARQYGCTLLKLSEALFRCHALQTEDEDFSQNFGAIAALSKQHAAPISPLSSLIFHYNAATYQLNENNFVGVAESLSMASQFSKDCTNTPFHLFTLVTTKIQHCLLENNFDLFSNLLPEARALFLLLIHNYLHFPHLIKTVHFYLSTLNFALGLCYTLAEINEGDLRVSYIKIASLAHQEILHSIKSIKAYYPNEIITDGALTYYSNKLSVMIADNRQHTTNDTVSLMSFSDISQYFTDFLSGIRTVLLADHCSPQCLEDSAAQLEWIKANIIRIISQSHVFQEKFTQSISKLNTTDHFNRLTNLSIKSLGVYIEKLTKFILACEKLQLRIDAHYYKASLEDPNNRLPERYNRHAVGLNDQEVSSIKRSNSTHNFFAFFDGEVITKAAIAPRKHHINPRIYTERKGPGQ